MTAVVSPPNLMGELGLEVWHDDAGDTRGRLQVTAAMCVPGTDRLRLGVLATIVDVVSGIPQHGPINPTIDLRLTLLAPPPATGTIEATCRPLKVGRRLFLGEALLRAGPDARPFARGLATFINRNVTIPPVFDAARWSGRSPRQLASFDELVDLRPVGSDTTPRFEVDGHAGIDNTAGTISGGGLALIAELAAERVLPPEPEWAGIEIDLRFLNGVKVGPVVAAPEREAVIDGAQVRVPLTEGGDRSIALALARFVPVEVFRAGGVT